MAGLAERFAERGVDVESPAGQVLVELGQGLMEAMRQIRALEDQNTELWNVIAPASDRAEADQ